MKIFKIVFVFLALLFFTASIFAQPDPKKLSGLGFKYDVKLKGPKGKKIKVIEINYDDYHLAVKYKIKGKQYLVRLYEMFTWNQVCEYWATGLAELYNSYTGPEGKYYYLNVDVFKEKYQKIEVSTSDAELVECEQTPKGCRVLERMRPIVFFTTEDQNYVIFRDNKYRKNVKVYINKELKKMQEYVDQDIPDFLKEEEPEIQYLSLSDLEKIIEGESVVYGGLRYKLGSPANNNEYELNITEEDIVKLKAGDTVEYKGKLIKLETE